ncbi:hypothetical protein POTG_02644 [Paenibacillus sp. oral taxon 786 str. D14]|uniref:DUF2920 family protein n=1 Tax=Paenibacillus sp. oral taxon 786 TaxID=652715 RepID=UPI0001AFD7C3|nr:DUF2920 family protein [Paenibacillus sp. oral taxon 786]EES72697.1 hypothetical protein POTG_02644 [Paenibacillus sp. oral taxon 786 str. D14]
MSIQHEIVVDAHPNIYTGHGRKLSIYFSEPSEGVNENTGLILFIPGYGGHARSNVYQKMRRQFADQYNLICIQCDYFGYEHMQLEDTLESLDNFNDMSLMQVLDNLTAVLMVKEILKENGIPFNGRKIICSGQSHGAYLAYLCNRFAPHLFSMIIDNSAYLRPVYLDYIRNVPSHNLQKRYYVCDLNLDRDVMDLVFLYRKFENKSNIVSFHGVYDQLIGIIEKINFCNSIPNCRLNVVNDTTLYKGAFKTAHHGMDADFIKFFDLVMGNYKSESEHPFQLPNVRVTTKQNVYTFDYSSGLVRLMVE